MDPKSVIGSPKPISRYWCSIPWFSGFVELNKAKFKFLN